MSDQPVLKNANSDSTIMAEQASKTSISSNSAAPQTLALNTHKAGMEGLDTEKINEIIKKASEGSRFYQHKQKCQQRLDAKIAEMKRAAESFSEEQIKKATFQMDQIIKELESKRDLTRTIIHVDMDMFYAAVEMRDDPSLRDKPMAVGSTGMLSTSNYAARKFGVRAAMPGFIGKKLCPDLIIVKPDFTKYKKASKDIQEIFAEYDPNFCPMSLDEAYLDITEYLQKNAHTLEISEEDEADVECETPAERVVKEMRQKICEKTNLTASAGIASNTRLAKVCSDMNKPNGQFYLPPDLLQISDFVSSLPIRKVSGIGNVMEQQLRSLGIDTCADLLDKRGLLKLLFSDINYNSFLNIALGLGHTTLSTWTEKDRKSISTETTFRGTADRDTLFSIIRDLCAELAEDMAEKDIFGKVFTLKFKTVDFQIRSRAHTFPDAVRSAEVMATTARRILQHEMDAASEPLSLRLIGVRMSNLLSASEIGPNRQSTLTQLFAQSANHKSTKNSSEHKLNIEKVASEEVNGESNSNIQSLKSTTIGHYLTKPQKMNCPAKNTSYRCPVCDAEIKVLDLSEFNDHVDLCLLSGSSQEINKSKEKGNEKAVLDSCIINEEEPSASKNIETLKDIGKNIPQSQNSTLSEMDKGIYTFSDYESDENLDYDENIENQSKSNEQVYSSVQCHFSCPVCEKQEFRDISALNEHVDECLSKSAITEMLQQGMSEKRQTNKGGPQLSKSGCKRKGSNADRQAKKVKHVNNTIEKFFNS